MRAYLYMESFAIHVCYTQIAEGYVNTVSVDSKILASGSFQMVRMYGTLTAQSDSSPCTPPSVDNGFMFSTLDNTK